MNRSRFLACLATLVVAAPFNLTMQGASDADAAAGRALVKRYADAIIGVELVVTLKVKVGDREQPPQEQRVDVNGTVVSASGLTVTSLSLVDPAVAFENARSQRPNSRVELLGVDFKEVKLRLADGSEVPARFVLKDADLDLAFMAPDYSTGAAKREFPFVKLDESAEGAVLGSYFYVARAPKVLQRVPMIRTTEINGMVEKPRRFYLLPLGSNALGTPVFDVQGRLLGITLQSIANSQAPVVLPAADIAEMTKQASAAQAAPPPVPAAAPTPAPAAAEEKKD